MSFWRRFSSMFFGRPASEERKVYQIQLLLLFALSTLLYLGFPGTREWRRAVEAHHMRTIIHGWDGLDWYVWLAAAPVMLVLIRRYPLVRGRIGPSLGRIAWGSLIIYLAVTHARYFLCLLPSILSSGNWSLLMDLDSYAFNTYALLPIDLLTFSGFFAVSFAIDSYSKHRQHAEQAMQLQVKAAQLQSDLDRAELAALRGQLHPHFLFNSFNALATLVRQRKNEAAVEVIAQLSALLRIAIDRTGLQEIPLHQEIDFIQRYLDIEHMRFGDKLRVEFALAPATLEALVPNIVLQPLVENAIKHGISLRTSPGTVRLAATRRRDRLHVEITDDGPEGAPPGCTEPPEAKKPGIGLANTRAQLDKLYGADYQLEITKQPAGGTVVTLNLPWRIAPVN